MTAQSNYLSQKDQQKKLLTEVIIETEDANKTLSFTDSFKHYLITAINKKHAYVGGGALVVGTFVANVLNYIFSAYLGRILSFSDFALIGLMSSFLSFAGILFGAYTFTVNYSCSFLIGQKGDAAAYGYLKYIRKRSIVPSLINTVLWLLVTPLLMQFFHTNNFFLFFLFGVILLIGFTNSINQGFLAAKLLFGSMAIIGLVDPVVRLSATFLLSLFGLPQWAFATMVLSFFVDFLFGLWFIKRQSHKDRPALSTTQTEKFSNKLFLLSLISGFSAVAYFTFDIFLAKHYLSPAQAGEYTLVSLVGKMIFFLGSLTSPFITPIISRYEGAKKNSLHPLYALISITTLFSLVGFIFLGLLSHITIPLLYGERARAIVPYVLPFTFGMACYTVSSVLVNYYMVKKLYTFIGATSLLVFFQVGFITLFHQNIGDIVTVMTIVLTANLLVTVILHFIAHKVKAWEKAIATRLFSFLGTKIKQDSKYVYALTSSINKFLNKGVN